MSVPNQRIVQIGKRTVRNGQNLYATMNLEALQLAMKTLKGSSLKMWLYLNKNQENYTFELSRAASLEWGIKKDSYYDGMKELIEKGYLVQAREGSNFYTFYELPRSGKQNSDKPNHYFMEETTMSSAKQNLPYGNPKGTAGNQYRNNIYNTDILHNKTASAKPDNDNEYWEELERQEEQEARKRTWAYRGDALGF